MHASASSQTVIIAPGTPGTPGRGDGHGDSDSAHDLRRASARAAAVGVPATLLGDYLEDAVTTAFACEEYGPAFADDDEETCISPRAATVASPPWARRYELVVPLRMETQVRVHRAYDRVMGRELALHELSPLAGTRARRAFEHEVYLGGRLLHPGLLRVHDAGTDRGGDLRWFVTDLLRGQSLATGIEVSEARGRGLPVPLTLDLFRETLRTLDYLHRAGWVHGDLRPQHLWITRDPNTGEHHAKLLGLGSARPSAEARDSNETRATGCRRIDCHRFAPDVDDDLYAVGRTIRLALCPVGESSDPFDVALNRVIARACARDRRDRFGDARAMLGALGAIRTQ